MIILFISVRYNELSCIKKVINYSFIQSTKTYENCLMSSRKAVKSKTAKLVDKQT